MLPIADPGLLKSSITVHEGIRLLPYDDATGKPLHPGDTLKGNITIGVGHNLSSNGLTAVQVDNILGTDIALACALTEQLLPWLDRVDDCRRRAFVEMVFNIGSRIQTFHRALQAAEQGYWQGCVTELRNSLWSRQVGHRAIDLEHMILTGQDPTPGPR